MPRPVRARPPASPPAPRPAAYREGLKHLDAGRLDAAIAALERAHKEAPADAGVLFALATAARRLGLTEAARRLLGEVLLLEPGRPEAIVSLANLHRAEGRPDAAIALLRPALEAEPRAAELWLTLGHAVRESGDPSTARTFYEEAARLKPSYAEAYGSLADLASDARDEDRALFLYDKAIRLAPANAQLRLNRAVLLLHMGRLAEGWRDYEWRQRLPAKRLEWTHGLPAWDGRVRPGLRLLVTAEQGLGDQILFASLLPELSASLEAEGGALIADCEPRLRPLFARALPRARIEAQSLVETGGRRFAAYGWLEKGAATAALPMGSLPRFLRPRIGDFPARHAYLAPEPAEAARWQAWLASLGPGPRIGLCWRSGSTGGLRALQYAPLAAWANALAMREAQFVCLQYDAREEEIEELEAVSRRTVHRPPAIDQKQEIDRAAALIYGLDAVVSAPTAVASISAALGVPTAKVLYDKSWTALGRDFEPFQPACRLAMPARAGDWPAALDAAFALTGL